LFQLFVFLQAYLTFDKAGKKISSNINAIAGWCLQLCLSLGWARKERTQFDVLPLVLQANSLAPEVFLLPDDIVLQVPLVHPS
jgi:nitric oxide synthase oxygenase domain/subunit